VSTKTSLVTSRRAALTARVVAAAATALLTVGLAACGSSGSSGSSGAPASGGSAAATDTLTMGFAQVGAESGWRTANTKSIQDSAAAAGVDLKFSDAQQKQENQIKAIRSYIQQKVDIIAFSPVVESGWDTVLLEAKRAQIPVILTDRSVDSTDDSLYVTFLGSDFIAEGKKAGDWLVQQYQGNTAPVSIVELQGTTGAAPAIDRKEGFTQAISGAPNLQIVASQTGDFTRSGGKQVMEAFLKSQPKIDVVYAHNDDMGLGAIEAIEAAGKVPGKDIKIITVDAVKDGMQALADGKINFIVECNPLLGPQLMDLAKQVKAGQQVPKRVVTEETTFDQAGAQAVLAQRQY
jgi:galactofuranose transport system substrate-binding protein